MLPTVPPFFARDFIIFNEGDIRPKHAVIFVHAHGGDGWQSIHRWVCHAYVLAGGPWAAAGAVIGAVAGAFAPSVYDGVRERGLTREAWQGSLERRASRSLPEHSCTAGQRRKWRASRPVGRVLCTRGCGPTAIHLGLPLPTASCGLPASIGRAVLKRSRRKRKIAGRFPLGLAPGGVYQAARVTPGAGGLLHHRFTLTPGRVRGRSVFCGTFPRVTPGRRYRPPCPAEPGPSSTLLADQERRGRPACSPAAVIRIGRYPPIQWPGPLRSPYASR